jgi:hypothetical protein
VSMAFDILTRRARANVLRPPAMSGGKRGDPATVLVGIACSPLDPADAEVRQRLGLNGPIEIYQTFVDAEADIRQGDYLQTREERYSVRAVGDWVEFNGETFRQLFLEQFKQ